VFREIDVLPKQGLAVLRLLGLRDDDERMNPRPRNGSRDTHLRYRLLHSFAVRAAGVLETKLLSEA
jgi:hypothetical protein